jgi:hypothetical protein
MKSFLLLMVEYDEFFEIDLVVVPVVADEVDVREDVDAVVVDDSNEDVEVLLDVKSESKTC